MHGANGYLINQFLRVENQPAHGRIRRQPGEPVPLLPGECWKPCWRSGPRAGSGARISPNGVFNDMGCAGFPRDLPVRRRADSTPGPGYLHVMDGLAFGFHEQGEPMTLAEFRPLFSGTLIGNCGYTKERPRSGSPRAMPT